MARPSPILSLLFLSLPLDWCLFVLFPSSRVFSWERDEPDNRRRKTTKKIGEVGIITLYNLYCFLLSLSQKSLRSVRRRLYLHVEVFYLQLSFLRSIQSCVVSLDVKTPHRVLNGHHAVLRSSKKRRRSTTTIIIAKIILN